MNIIDFLQTFSATRNCIFGICSSSPLNPAHLQKSTFVPFVNKNIQKRTDPSAILPNVKSIFVFGVGFSRGALLPCNFAGGKAQLSSLGTNEDYHLKINTLLGEFINELLQHINFKYKILVDSPYLDERAFAARAGIGFFGRNGLIISQKFGSRFNIGLLLTDIPMPNNFFSQQDESFAKCPPNCRLCISACPNNALSLNSPLNAQRCVSYLTQKKELTEIEKTMLSNQLYGCDICQDVCPFNSTQYKTANPFCAGKSDTVLPEYEKTCINPHEWLNMNDNAFYEKFGYTAMLWQGTKLLRRNAEVVLTTYHNNA